MPSGGKVTIQVQLQSDSSSIRGHFAVLNKSIDSGEDNLLSREYELRECIPHKWVCLTVNYLKCIFRAGGYI